MDTAAPVDPNAWQTVTNKRNRPRQQPCSPVISPGLTTPGQSRPAKRSCNSFAVMADPPASSDPGMRAVADAGVAETAAAAHTSRIAGGDSPGRPHSMTLRPKRVSGLRTTAAAAAGRSEDVEASHTSACQQPSAGSQTADSQISRQPVSRQPASRQPVSQSAAASGQPTADP